MCPDFVKVPAPVFTPTQCVTCSTQHDPGGFIDLLVDLPVSGHLYCCSSCVGQAADRMGWLEPRVADEIRGEARAWKEQCEDLTDELAKAQGLGTWTFAPSTAEQVFESWREKGAEAQRQREDADPLVCPDCGQPKGAGSKRCRSCSARAAVAAKKTGASA